MNPRLKWTILGAGNLIFDLLDAIESRSNILSRIVLNQQTEINFQGYTKLVIINLEEFNKLPELDELDYCIFGFLNPKKIEFIDSIKPNLRKFGNLIHKTAYLSFSQSNGLSDGNYFGPHVTIAPHVKIEGMNFFNRNCSVGHDTEIGNFNHIGPGATVCGRCKIGYRNFIGAGSVIKDGIQIWNDITVGAGAVVTNDLTEAGTYVGVPAKKLCKPTPPPHLFQCHSF